VGVSNRVLFLYGAAVGLFVGLLVGLSVSPVVATVVSAIVGVVTAFCTATLGGGLKEAIQRSRDRGTSSSDAHIYLAGFCVAGFVSCIIGIYLRTHNALSPTPHELVDEWRAAGLTQQEAQEEVLHEYGRGNTGTQVVEESGKSDASTRYTGLHSVLIGDPTVDCDEIAGYIARQEWNYAESFFQKAGGPWRARYEQIRALPDDQRHAAMAEFVQQSCGKATP
jgi:hypothetical protein